MYNRQRRNLRAVQHAWSFLCTFVGVAVGLSALDQSEPSRRGILVFIGVQAIEVFVDFINRGSLLDMPQKYTVETQTCASKAWLRRTRSSS
jgi:hypothetical protein